ncbi:hypothetical protein ITP53_39400 [Nonomuraea sp. K274]|uniref:HK97 gp10 family phage protein n=1 Tax=Nonomuraea cypriaca TaxID=1187855 RepID=A0A931F2L5_9ACTN|nr:hypothetical protein [Nonomuraea cypriaca]MBF8191660.1 hypothetical protein [Nonomuraea cypriaca]
MAQRATLKLNVGKIRAAERAGANRGGRLAVEHLLQVSRTKVPHEEGTLERSGVASWDDAEMRGAVSYDTPYAIPQHERLEYQHDEGRQAKYLEEPLMTEAAVMGELFAAQVRRSLRG